MDLVLSSGFLAFARHLGFLKAVEEAGVSVDGICGTSSGAIVGSLWAAGAPIEDMAKRLHVPIPIRKMRVSRTPWRGIFTIYGLQPLFEDYLPPNIEDLPRPFGIGVTDPKGKHTLLTEGPLLPAVAASCAIPAVFASVPIGGVRYRDGGVADRVGLEAWRAHRDSSDVLVHLVERSMGKAQTSQQLDGATVVRTPRSHAKLWNIGPFEQQLQEAYEITLQTLKSAQMAGSNLQSAAR